MEINEEKKRQDQENHKVKLEACLSQLSRTFEAQVELARTFLGLHTVPSSKSWEAAEGAVERLAAAVRHFDQDLHRATELGPGGLQGGKHFVEKEWLSENSAQNGRRLLVPETQFYASSWGRSVAQGPRFESKPTEEWTCPPEHAAGDQASCAASVKVTALRAGPFTQIPSAKDLDDAFQDNAARLKAKSQSLTKFCLTHNRSESAISLVKESKDFMELSRESSLFCTDEVLRGRRGSWREEGIREYWQSAFPNGVMSPQWSGRLLWDVSVILLVLMDAIVLPFQMAYKNSEDPDSFDTTWLSLTTAIFSTDIVMNFFTAYEAGRNEPDTTPGTIVTSKVRIAKHYIRGWFSIDLMSTIPWQQLADLVFGGAGQGSTQVAKLTKVVKFVRFLRLMRMLRLAKLATIWDRIECHLGSILLLQTVALVRVIFCIIAICHWNACIFWMVGLPRSMLTEMLSDEAQTAYEAGPHWTTVLRKHGPMEAEEWTWLEKDTTEAYVFCFYWTLGVMRTMPAEVQPVNLPERIFVLVFMFFALSAFAITVAQITQAFFKFSERKRIFTEEIAAVRMHLRAIGANEALQYKVKAYLNHIFTRRKIQAKEKVLLETLPPVLKKQLTFTQKMCHLKRLDVFQLAPQELHLAISEMAEFCDMLPGDILCRSGRPAASAWVVVTGRVQVLDSDTDSEPSGDFVEPRRSWAHHMPQTSLVELVDQECLLAHQDLRSKVTVAVVEASEVLRIEKSKFQAWLTSSNPTWLPGFPDMNNQESSAGVSGDGPNREGQAAAATMLVS